MAYDSESDDLRDVAINQKYNMMTPMSLGSSYENNQGSPSHWICHAG